MKKSVKFAGKKDGLYDFVTVASNATIAEVESFLISKGWSELEFISLGERDNYETYSL